MSTLTGRRIVVAGATGLVGMPITRALAADNEVWALARFTDAGARAQLEAAGARCVPWDAVTCDLSAVPGDVDHLLNFVRPPETGSWDFDAAITSHAEAAGLLVAHFRSAASILHCSSTSLYARLDRPSAETDPLTDDRHTGRPTYTIAKISAEAAVRTMARHVGTPTVIARLNVPYSDAGGWPAKHLEAILADQPIPIHDVANRYNPIHTDDILRTIPALLDVASVPATIVNWGGDELVSIEEWSAYLGELVGTQPRFAPSPAATEGMTIDTTRLLALAGPMSVSWRDGVRRMASTLHPDLVH